MKEDKTIVDFNTRVLDISNESFALGESMREEKLVRKVLRSLPKQYDMKAIAIKEAQDVTTMSLDELMGSLQTHEMKMDEEEQHKKVKSVGLKSEVIDVQDNEGEMSEQQYDKLEKNFGKFMRRINKKGSDPGQSSTSRFQKDVKFQKKNKFGDFSPDNKGKGIQCRECDCYEHIQADV
ncbi:unnamed protein product [Rhodiola kirilowii]